MVFSSADKLLSIESEAELIDFTATFRATDVSEPAIVYTALGQEIRTTAAETRVLRSIESVTLRPGKAYRLDLDFDFMCQDTKSDAWVEFRLVNAQSGEKVEWKTFSASGAYALDFLHPLVREEKVFGELEVKSGSPIRLRRIALIELMMPALATDDDLARILKGKTVSVVIVTYNRKTAVCNLLDSLLHLDVPASCLRFLVVDNNSNDGTEAHVRATYPNVEFLQTGANLGGSGGFIAGVRHVLEKHASSEYIWLLDNDVVVEHKTLSELLRILVRSEEVGAAGSMMCQLDDPSYINEVGGFLRWQDLSLGLLHHRQKLGTEPREPVKVEYCAAASLLTRRAEFEQIGLFEDVFIHFDDIEWCLRLRQHGKQVMCVPTSRVWHESGAKKQTTWIRYYDVRNLLRVISKYQPELLSYAKTKLARRARYFGLHGFPKTAKLIASGIRDFKRGRMGAQKLETDPLVPISELYTCRFRFPVVAVFAHEETLQAAAKQLPPGLLNSAEIFLYDCEDVDSFRADMEITGKIWVRPPATHRLRRAWFYLRQLRATLMNDSTTIMDGEFEFRRILPPLRPALYVYGRFGTAFVQQASRLARLGLIVKALEAVCRR